MKTIYFQPPGIKPQFCEVGMIHESDPEYIWYLDEPCKILISEVKIIPKESVTYDKKSRSYLVQMNIDTTNAPNTTETAIGFIPCYRLPFLSLFHADCMEIMKQYPDKYFDLAIVDPPYGIGMDKTHFKTKSSNAKPTEYGKKDWDNAIPSKEYFNELLRVSKNQIVWGGNYFVENLTNSSCWVVWDKDNGDSIHADCELAWTSFNTSVKKVKWLWHGMRQQNMKNKQKRIHPTEKPIQLYEFLIKEYSKPNFKILDTHFGSGSIALAVDKANRLDKMNLHLTACEIDKEYIDKAIKRISESIKQGTLSF